jgi:hypothetical protein
MSTNLKMQKTETEDVQKLGNEAEAETETETAKDSEEPKKETLSIQFEKLVQEELKKTEEHLMPAYRRSTWEFVAKSIGWSLKIESATTGFILKKSQFVHIAKFFKKYAKEKQGLWALQFHPKSGHVIHEVGMKTYVYKTLGLSKNFGYFRWSFNGLFCEDWVEFSKLLEQQNCKFVLVGNRREGGDYLASCRMDNDYKMYFEMKTHVGGGRGYYEPRAQPYKNYGSGIEID